MFSVPGGVYAKDSEFTKLADGSGYQLSGAELLQKVDQAVDESFPASDPPAVSPHVD